MANKKFKTMVICSTLNQMVNYMAIKEHGIERVINITVEEGTDNILYRKFPYKEWDENLFNVLDNEIIRKDIKFDSNQIVSHEQLIEKFKKDIGQELLEDESVLWNITGGQRHFVMAITYYVNQYRKNDDLLYYEGDRERFYYYNSENSLKNWKTQEKNFPMTIPIALRLMGFEVDKNSYRKKSDHYKLLIEQDEKTEEYKEYDYYKKLYDLYVENEDLVKILIKSNRPKDEKGEKKHFDSLIKDIFQDDKIPKDLFEGKQLDVLKDSLGGNINGKVFGYILERLAFYKIIDILKNDKKLIDKIADIEMSKKIKGDGQVDKHSLDEFDILLLTKAGKLVVFECKSGKMSGDNAKSTNYSTYRIAGVYGMPVLIDPLTKDLNTNKEDKDIFNPVKYAEKAAARAGMTICRMKNDYNKNNIWDLESYIQEILGG